MNIHGNMTFRTVQARDTFTDKLRAIQSERGRYGAMIPRMLGQLENPVRNKYDEQKNHLIYLAIKELIDKMSEEEIKLVKLEEGFPDQ